MGRLAASKAASPGVKQFGEMMVASGQDPQLRQLAADKLPTLKHHLQGAQSLSAREKRRPASEGGPFFCLHAQGGAVTRHTLFPASSATSSEPSLAIATPTGRP